MSAERSSSRICRPETYPIPHVYHVYAGGIQKKAVRSHVWHLSRRTPRRSCIQNGQPNREKKNPKMGQMMSRVGLFRRASVRFCLAAALTIVSRPMRDNTKRISHERAGPLKLRLFFSGGNPLAPLSWSEACEGWVARPHATCGEG